MADKRVILPANVTPELFELHLTPNYETCTFEGYEKVTLIVKKATNVIVVNGVDLVASKAVLNGAAATKIDHDAAGETITFTFASAVHVGKATLEVSFSGVLNDKLVGFYRSKYEFEGKPKYLATTQFEPVDARLAFPCWDEPAIKCVYRISLTVPTELTALSNMPEKKTVDNGNGTKTVSFEDTPMMCSYIVAFCAGHLECVETKSKAGVTVRIWTTPGKKALGQFALEVGAKVIDYFSDYYQIPYPLPKEDMIAVPDFAMGAMENWGLITYRETALLCDPATASVASKGRIAYVIAHELAHQWFGNLVTMEWWKELWLNEGFATFVGTQAIGHFFPEWQVWTQFLTDYHARALSVDSLRNSHPIEVEVAKARTIMEIFDAISYCKGASIIRMLSEFVGEAAFRKGLNIYLNKFKYSNATTKDLWAGISEGFGKDVSAMMQKWTSDIGYPVVTVEETAELGKFKVTQNRFLASGDVKPEEDQTLWTIQIAVASQSSPKVSYVEFSTRSAIISIPVKSNDEWVKLNAGQSGFFRVAYSESMSAKLGSALAKLELNAADRHGIQADAFALARAGSIPLSRALALVQNYVNETDYTVWSDLAANLGDIAALLDGTEASAFFDKYCLALFSKISKLGWDSVPGEPDLHKTLRGIVLNKLAGHGDGSIAAEAKVRFAKYIENPASLASDVQAVVFKTAMRNGGQAEYDAMVNIYKNATLPELRIRALSCIGFSKQPELIQKALDYSLTAEVRSQDLTYLVSSCGSTAYGRDLTWKFLKANWIVLTSKMPAVNLTNSVIKNGGERFATEQKLSDFEAFFATNTPAGSERTVQQVIEAVKGNILLLSRNKDSVTQWLKQNFA